VGDGVRVGVGVSVGEADVNITCPKSASIVFEVVSVTVILSVPAFVEVMVNDACPDVLRVVAVGLKTAALSFGDDKLTESPDTEFPELSSKVIETLIVDDPFAGA
jgi:hypothetical protein